MPITPNNPFKGRQHPGEVIILCVRWYLRYPLSYEHVAEQLGERGVEVDASCIWRWVQAYAPELNKRCRPHTSALTRRIDQKDVQTGEALEQLACRAIGQLHPEQKARTLQRSCFIAVFIQCQNKNFISVC